MNPPTPSAWLSPELWHTVQQTMPIACVDVVPVRVNAAGVIAAVGLIDRDTPHQGRRWCVVGGRLLRDEPLATAITRQVRETLGPAVTFDPGDDPQPTYVVTYFSTPQPVGLHDPRQHALTLNFVIPLTGDIKPAGEAHDFCWFDPTRLPAPDEIGFGQALVVAECLRRYRPQPTP